MIKRAANKISGVLQVINGLAIVIAGNDSRHKGAALRHARLSQQSNQGGACADGVTDTRKYCLHRTDPPWPAGREQRRTLPT